MRNLLLGRQNNMDDKEAKRIKQAEYARQLQQDNAPTQQHQHNRNSLVDNSGGGGLGIIGKPCYEVLTQYVYQCTSSCSGQQPQNDKESRRNKQAEYARQLRNDNTTVPAQSSHNRNFSNDSGAGGLGVIGIYQSKVV